MHPINEQLLTWSLLISVIYRTKDNVYDVVATNSPQFTHECKNKLLGFIFFCIDILFFMGHMLRERYLNQY